MKTLQTIKEDYAKEQGCDDWNDLIFKLVKQECYHTLNTHFDSVMKLYAMECLKKASENADIERCSSTKSNHHHCIDIDKGTINNINNLI